VRSNAVLLQAKLVGCLEERERIARELHDTLLQSTQGLILTFHSLAGQLPRPNPMRTQMELALDRADQLLNEARDRVKDLRSTTFFTDMTQAISRAAHGLLLAHPCGFSIEVKGTPRPLQQNAAEDIFSIAREALANAFSHAGAKAVEAEIVYETADLHIRVRDDGRGIRPGIVNGTLGLRHFGIRGMRERAGRIGARLDIWSRDGAGTEISLTVPASSAYRGMQTTSRWQWLFRGTALF
jgi:signal transduction histidine kinase